MKSIEERRYSMARGRKKGYVNPMKGIKRGSDQYWDIQYNTYLNKRQD